MDDSKDRFTHGRPDAELLRNFCKEKFNWGPDKVDEILEPVLKVSPSLSSIPEGRTAEVQADRLQY